MANTLGLDCDLDPILLIEDLEQAFGLKFSDEDVGSCGTVGDIHALLVKRMGGADRQPERCATAMAFHRLRHAFHVMAPEVAITPTTPLYLFSRWPPKSLLKQLGLHSGLRLPRPARTKAGEKGALLILIAVLGVFASALLENISSLAALWSFRFSVFALPVGALILKLDQGRLPDGCETVADVARMASARNFGMLAREGAGWSEGSLWRALVEIASERTGLSKSDIGPDTLLLQKALRE